MASPFSPALPLRGVDPSLRCPRSAYALSRFGGQGGGGRSMSAVPVSAMGRSAERPPRRLLRPPSSRSRRYAGLPVSACGLRLGHAPPVTLLRTPPQPSLSGEGVQGPARTALRASSWQPVVVPAGELDEGLPGRSEPSFLSGRGPPSPGASISGGRVAGAAPRSAMVATGWRPLVSEDRAIMREVGNRGVSEGVIPNSFHPPPSWPGQDRP